MSYAQVQMCALVCDGDSCTERYRELDTRFISQLRVAAAALGWTHEKQPGSSNWPRSVDFCPACSVARQEAKSA